jgi:peptidyl-prolyl cis-trans isomerase B (cyclophilin B)
MVRITIHTATFITMAALFAANSHVSAQNTKADAEKIYVKMSTNLGDMYLELDADKSPITVENFLAYAKSGHFEGTIFHRVMDGFMAQGGGFLPDYSKKKVGRDPIRNEADNGLKNKYGTLAMARTGDPHSATAQFFINCADNSFLDHKAQTRREWGYCVFGKIAAGTVTLEKITSAKVKFDERADRNSPARPVEAIVIKTVVRVKDDDKGFAKAKKLEAETLAKAEEAKKMAAEYAEKIKEQALAFYKDSEKGTTTDSGLRYLDVEVGEGAQPAANGKVTVHYSGWLVDGKKFDSSRDRGQTISFGLGQVIKGWGEGVGSMKVGGKRILVIPPALGYGDRDQGPIPGGSTLIFEVELVDAG